MHVAFAAMTRAARDFDPGRHKDFLSYAAPTIRGELIQQYGRAPRPSEVAAHLGVDLDDMIDAMAADGCFAPSSLDRPLSGVDGTGLTTVGDQLGGEDYLRLFEGCTQQQIADDIGVTQMQVSRLLTRIMRDLRAQPTPDGRCLPSLQELTGSEPPCGRGHPGRRRHRRR